MPDLRIDRLDAAAQDDVGERLQIEPRRERLTEAPHGGLQARPLVLDQAKAALRRLDPRAALA